MVWSDALLSCPHNFAFAISNLFQRHFLDARLFSLGTSARTVEVLYVCVYWNCDFGCRGRSWIGNRSDLQCYCEFIRLIRFARNCKNSILQNGCAVGPALMAPFLGLAIYGFDFAADIPALMNAVMKLSFIRGGIVTLILTVFGHNRQQLTCSEVYCHFDDPKVLLRYLRIEDFSLIHELGYLMAIMITFRFLFYLSLRKRFYK